MMFKPNSQPHRPNMAGSIKTLIFSLALGVMMLMHSSPQAQAQDTGAQLLYDGIQFINAQQYEEARAKLEDLTTNYKSSLAVAEGYAKLGYVYLLLNDFEKARENLEEAINWPNASESVIQLAMNLLPQAISAQAGAVEDDDARQKALYGEAITEFDKFIARFPDAGAATEGAYYGKGLAQYLIQEYAAAEETLNQAISLYPQSESLGENKYLLAIAISSRAVKLFQENPEANSAQYLELQQRALGLLDEVKVMTGAQRNEAVINDAHFQTGEILLNIAAATDGAAEKEQLWTDALQAYRQVKPREAMITALQEQITQTIGRIRGAVQARNAVAQEQLESVRDRLMLKLIQLRSKPPQTIDAKLGMARVMYQQERMDETRVLLKFVENFELSEQQAQNLLYYLTLTYARQGIVEPAVSNYENFQAKFADSAMAENLPLVMGNLFLGGANSDPERAMGFYQNYFEKYPEGELLSAAWVSQAKALELLGRMDEAEAAYQKAVESQPDEQVAMTAELGLANNLYNQQKWDEAIAKYDAVLQTYPEVTGSEEALFRKGSAMMQKGTPQDAVTVLNQFLEQYPEHAQRPFVLLDLGKAQAEVGFAQTPPNTEQINKGLATLESVPQDFPQTEAAPYAYFEIANIHAKLNDPEGMREAFQTFLTNYPNQPADQIYFVYSQLAQLLLNATRTQDAAVLWKEFVDKYPQHPNVDVALITVAMLWQQSGNALGPYNGLDSAQQAEWTESMRLAVDNAQQLVSSYPESNWVTEALTMIRDIKDSQVRLRLIEREEVVSYLEELANSLAPSPAASQKAMFTFASYIFPDDPERAVEIMRNNYSPEVRYAPQDLDIFALQLLEMGEIDQAEQIFQGILNANPQPEDKKASDLPRETQEARAIALYGLGAVATARGDVDAAGQNFIKLREDFPWHPKIGQARYGIALSLFREKKLDAALDEVVTIIRDHSKAITSDLRAKAFLLGGKILMTRNGPGDPATNMPPDLQVAREYIQKLPVAYSNNTAAVAEAYWLLAKIYEQQGDEVKKNEALGELEKISGTPFSGKPLSDPLPES